MWWFYALLSALFASFTAITAKIGVKDIDTNLATALRTAVILVIAWGIVAVQGHLKDIGSISTRNLVFLGISGVCTGLSWLCYFKALQLGKVSQVAPVDKASLALTLLLSVVILGEPMTLKEIIAGGFILTGTLLFIL